MLSPIDQFLAECNAVRAGRIPAITGLRQRALDTGLSIARMRLVAEAADVDLVYDGDDFKVIKPQH